MSADFQTIPAALKHWADTKPKTEIFIFVNKHGRSGTFTARDIYVLSGKFAAQLRGYGFNKGDIIGNSLPNSPERLFTDLGIIMAGCVPINIHILERDGSDFWGVAKLASCKGIVVSTQSGSLSLFQPFMSDKTQTSGCAAISAPYAPELRKMILCGRDPDQHDESFFNCLKNSKDDVLVSDAKPDDLAVLFATSGSTGFSKLVPRTHAEILTCGRSFKSAKDVIYFSDRPFGWMGGFPFDYLVYGSSRVVQDLFLGQHATTATDLWQVISHEKCTGAAILPSTIVDLVETFKDGDPGYSLGFIVTGGQPSKQNILPALGLITSSLVLSYSSTETGMNCFAVVKVGETFKDYLAGKPLANVEIKVVDQKDKQLPPGEDGQILVRSPYVLKSYYNQPTTTDPFTKDGFFRTGDRGTLDKEGNVFCYGRTGDVILQGPLLVYTSWPEGIISKCPGVMDAVVVGITKNNESFLVACVIPRTSVLTEKDVLEFYHKQFMSSSPEDFKPKIANVMFFDKFPHLHSGKINKKKLEHVITQKLESKRRSTASHSSLTSSGSSTH